MTVVTLIGRTVTTNCESGDVCSPSVTVKLKPPDWSPDTEPRHHDRRTNLQEAADLRPGGEIHFPS